MMNTQKTFTISLIVGVMLIGCAGDQAAIRKRVEAKKTMGDRLMQEGQPDAALQEWLEAAKEDPENAELQNAIGIAYRNLRDLDKAIYHFLKALRLKPNYPEAENNLGTVYLMKKQWDKAITSFEKAALNPLYRSPYVAYTNLGYAYHELGEYEKAIEYYGKAISRFVKYSPAYLNMGLSLEALGRTKEAEEAYRSALHYAPGDPKPHLYLGRLYLKLDDEQKASEELLLTIKEDPAGIYGKEARRLLEGISLDR
jgi:type IV pilus assembly protein PilF